MKSATSSSDVIFPLLNNSQLYLCSEKKKNVIREMLCVFFCFFFSLYVFKGVNDLASAVMPFLT